MTERSSLARTVVERLGEAMQMLPHAHANAPIWEPSLGGKRADAELDFQIEGKMFRLIIEVKKSVFPRDVREALWQVNKYSEYIKQHDPNITVVPLLAAESISTGAKELLRNELAGYYDTGGSLFIPARGAFIYVDKPPPQPLEKAVRTLFKGKRAQVFHALLTYYDKWFSVKELAELAKASPATTSETLSTLERFDWVESRGQGPSKERHLTQPGTLLDEWKKQIQASQYPFARRYFVPEKKPDEIINKIANACDSYEVEYALTQEAAAQRYAPFLTNVPRVSFRMAPGSAADRVLSELNARVVTEGANLTVIETKSQGEFLFRQHLDTIWLASPIQVYLDLLRARGRAVDMAENLRRERIGF